MVLIDLVTSRVGILIAVAYFTMGTKTVQWPANIAVYHPDSNHDAFIKATERWSIYKAPSFDSVVQPKTEQEVAEVVCDLLSILCPDRAKPVYSRSRSQEPRMSRS